MGEASISAPRLLVSCKAQATWNSDLKMPRNVAGGTCRARLATWRRFHHRRCKGRTTQSIGRVTLPDVTLRVAAASLCVGRPPDFDCCRLGSTRAPAPFLDFGLSPSLRSGSAQSSTSRRGRRAFQLLSRYARAVRVCAACDRIEMVTYGSDNSGFDRGNDARHSFRIGGDSGRERPAA